MTFRSLDMSHYLLVVPRDNAYETFNQLGKFDMVHINDSNDLGNRPFYQQLKRCDESLQRIQTMQESLKKNGKDFEEFDQTQTQFVQKLYDVWKEEAKELGVEEQKLIDLYEQNVLEEYTQFNDITARLEKLNINKKTILEKIACFETVQEFFGDTSIRRESQQYFENNVSYEDNLSLSGISYMVGIVESESQMKLNRTIFRVSRGYACTRTLSTFKFPGLEEFNEKVVLIIYPTSQSQILQRKIQRVVQTFCLSSFSVDEIKGSAKKSLSAMVDQYNEIKSYTEMNQKEMNELHEKIQSLNCIEKWRTYFWKEKYLYESLNKVEIRGQFFTANIFVPRHAVTQLTFKFSKIIPTPTLQELSISNPPTAFNTNSYTVISQQITDTYGVPRYQQINPAIFTTVTFPFFFGVMFGDIAHGGVLFALGLFLVFNDDRIRKSSLKMFSSLRYMITMMGFFAFYCGWIYNDFIGYNLNIFGSCIDAPTPLSDKQKEDSIQKSFPFKKDCIYEFGIDPIWGRAQNQLVFVNSLKMKLSVIIGVLHMIIGILIKASNARYFKKPLDFFFQFIPQIIFMTVLFGYMDFLIVFKWLQVWTKQVADIPPVQWAPSIISTMMNIGMGLGETGTEPNGNSNMWGETGNTSQDIIQMIILFVALICVPVMLFPKPIIEIRQLKQQKKHNPLMQNEDDLQFELQSRLVTSEVSSAHNSKVQEHDSGEIFVHQLIQTIEFVLGAISNTASYLRLWALSLAHSQLAKVFFQKTLESGYGPKLYFGIPIMIIGFYMLCWITFGILMCMDTMECFLHSLRLHWVEFQNKFYKGDGYAYRSFSFGKAIQSGKQKE